MRRGWIADSLPTRGRPSGRGLTTGNVSGGLVERLGARFLSTARRSGCYPEISTARSDFFQAANVRVVHATRRGLGDIEIHITRGGQFRSDNLDRVERVGRVLDSATHAEDCLSTVLLVCRLRFRHETRIAEPW